MVALFKHPFFKQLPQEHQLVVARMLEPLELSCGELLFRQGIAEDSAFFIVSGRLAIDVRLPGGEISRLAEPGVGTVVGELALLSEEHRRTASATALEETRVLIMQRRDLIALCAHYHPAALMLIEQLAQQVHQSTARLVLERLQLARAPVAILPTNVQRSAGAAFNIARFLSGLSISQSFSCAELEELVSLSQPWTLERNTLLFAPDSANGSSYLVVRGSIDLCAQNNGQLHRLAVNGPGKLFHDSGELLDESIRTVAIVRDRATVLEFSADALAILSNPENQLSYRFLDASMRSLMDRLKAETRALTRDRSQQQTRQNGKPA